MAVLHGRTKEEALDNAENAIKAYMEALDLKTDKTSEFTKRSANT